MPDRNENLEQVLGRFLNGPELQNAVDDIRAGDRLLSENPAPSPVAGLLAQINTEVALALAQSRRHRVWSIGRSVAATAAIVMIASMLFFFSGHVAHEIAGTHPGAGLAVHGWWDDKVVEEMSAEVDDVLQIMITIGLDDSYLERQIPDFDINELEELEMIAMSDDFWKG